MNAGNYAQLLPERLLNSFRNPCSMRTGPDAQQGADSPISSVSMQQKRAIPYGTAPSEASRRSGRSSALPYILRLLASEVYHDW